LRLFSFGGYGLALAALARVVFGAYDSYPDYGSSFFGGLRPIIGLPGETGRRTLLLNLNKLKIWHIVNIAAGLPARRYL